MATLKISDLWDWVRWNSFQCFEYWKELEEICKTCKNYDTRRTNTIRIGREC